jgi:hypothetical protein
MTPLQISAPPKQAAGKYFEQAEACSTAAYKPLTQRRWHRLQSVLVTLDCSNILDFKEGTLSRGPVSNSIRCRRNTLHGII